MARKRRRKKQSGEEAIFGIIIGVAALLYLSGVSLTTIITKLLSGLAILLLIGIFIWFIRGLIKACEPVDLKTGKPKTKQSSLAKERNIGGDAPPIEWSTELIAELDWRVFEKLCAKLWEEKGFTAKETVAGADGGVDFYLYASSTQQKIGAVQCKSWSSKQIGVNVLRELQGVVASEQLKLGLLMYSGTLSKAANEFLKGAAVTVKAQGDAEILTEIKKLPAERQVALLSEFTAGDYTTPSCPQCDVKLVKRTANNSGKLFWGCSNFPRCRFTLKGLG
jgi:restriction system protein